MGRKRTAGRYEHVRNGAVRGSGSRVRPLGVIALIAAACAGSSAERAPLQSDPRTDLEQGVARQMLDLVNRDRLAAGLPLLPWSPRDAATAHEYSIELSESRMGWDAPGSEGTADRVLVERIGTRIALRKVALAHDLDEAHRGLMSSPDSREILLSDSATDAGIGLVFGDVVSGRRRVFLTMFVNTRPSVDSVAAAETRTPDAVPVPASSTPPHVVPPRLLEGQRISGSPAIVPDDETKDDIREARRTKLVGSFKLCLTAEGTVASVDGLKATGFPAYDHKIMREMRKWRYRPYSVGGKAIPVCTAVTFIYSQR